MEGDVRARHGRCVEDTADHRHVALVQHGLSLGVVLGRVDAHEGLQRRLVGANRRLALLGVVSGEELVEHGVDVERLRDGDGLGLAVALDLEADKLGGHLELVALEALAEALPELVGEIATATRRQDHHVIDPEADGDPLRALTDVPDVGVNLGLDAVELAHLGEGLDLEKVARLLEPLQRHDGLEALAWHVELGRDHHVDLLVELGLSEGLNHVAAVDV